ncbi:5069_t:CDS:2 [Acaulospora morrowiae]|uniref:5069_t:CDS:1 n=1 Tax=Acaulospora morrowiae TaxID=94023 RepID=A0A9N9D0I8_9GLOM|nr:5069_t:CDS:2 [Acaulospora morrowiae]
MSTNSQQRRTSAPSLRVLTPRKNSNAAVEESLKTYKLLEALRSGDTAALSTILLTYQSSTPSSPASSISQSYSQTGISASPLLLATQCASYQTIEFIINNHLDKIDINHQDHRGNTALHYASQMGRIDVCELLLKQKNINDAVRNGEGKQAIDIAKNQSIADFLDENRTKYVEEISQLFRTYVSDSNYVGIQFLFQDPRASSLIDINLPSSSGSTLLHDAAKKKDLEMVKFCLNHGADVSIRDRKRKVAADLTKDERIKNELKQALPPSSQISLPSLISNQPPKLKGYLLKWTNYAGASILLVSSDDAGSSCRGSINMRFAEIIIDKSDPHRFEIIGKGSVRYHLRATHPNEAKKWITALTHSTMQFAKGEKTSRSSTADDSANGEPSRQGRSKVNVMSTQNSESTKDYSDRDRSRSSSDDSVEIDGAPHEDNYQMTISNVRVQLDLQNQLLDSLLSLVPNIPLPNSKESTTVELFGKSLKILQSLVDDVLRMSEERDSYWHEKLEKELKTKRLWEDSMRELVIEQAEMEEEIKHNMMEQKMRKKQLKAAVAEGQISPSSPLLSALSETFEHVSNKSEDFTSISHSRGATEISNLRLSLERSNTIASTLADEYDSDDEFYDAIDERSVNEEKTQLDSSGQKLDSTSEGKGDVVIPYISSSYFGYPEEIRDQLPLDQKSLRPEVSLWSILKNSIGKDLSKITLPVYFNEPTSMLQRMAEDMEYSELLDIAARQKCSTERILYVAAFAMSNYSSTVGRIAKPFNPLLGETYEYVRPDKAFRYISEQVSHHPPISACYCESPNYDFFAEVDVKSKFWGKSFEVLPQGVSHVNLKIPKDRWPNDANGSPEEFIAQGNPGAFSEHYSWKKVTTCVNNLIVGTPWIDHYGDMVIINHITGDKCVLTFKARGWRGKDAFEIRGYVKDSNDKEIWEIAGRWNERLVARRSNASLLSSSQEDDLGSDKAALNATSTSDDVLPSPSPSNSMQVNRRPIYLLWKRNPLPEEPIPFNLTPFSITLNDLPDSLINWVAPTDSRLRPDQRAMENGSYDLASSEKVRLEEKQREKRKNRERGLSEDHMPRWFRRTIEPDTGEKYWEFNHEYWKERERAGKEKMEGSEGRWNIEDDDIF